MIFSIVARTTQNRNEIRIRVGCGSKIGQYKLAKGCPLLPLWLTSTEARSFLLGRRVFIDSVLLCSSAKTQPQTKLKLSWISGAVSSTFVKEIELFRNKIGRASCRERV